MYWCAIEKRMNKNQGTILHSNGRPAFHFDKQISPLKACAMKLNPTLAAKLIETNRPGDGGNNGFIFSIYITKKYDFIKKASQIMTGFFLY